MPHKFSRLVPTSLGALLLSSALGAQAPQRSASPAPAFKGSDPSFTLRLDFNRWHSHEELKADLLRLEKAWPKFLKYQSVGKSHEGREMMVMTINNPDTGAELSKPAMYIEANVHGNEIQGAEVCLYTIWYLMEQYTRVPQIRKLVDERVFYIVPTVNPDGREHFLNVKSGGRSGHVPVDSDNDGLFDEDDVDDVNGNGVIEQIRKYVPGQGNLRKNAADPRLLEPAPQERPATTSSSDSRGWTTTAMASSTKTGPAGTIRTATGRPTGSRTTSRAARWTIRSSCPKPKRSTIS
jgi:hypothetical protein